MKLFQQYRGLRRENYVLFFGNIVTNMGSMVWPMMTMILDKKMGMSAGNIAVLLMAGTILCMPANLLGGRLADRMNKKHIIIAGDLVSITCYILCGLVPLSYVTVGLIMLASIFQSIEAPAYNALLADITPTRDREKAYSLLYLGANIGLMVAPTLSGFLFKDYLWLAFIISGIAIGCSTLLIGLKLKDTAPVRETSEEAEYQASRDGAGLWTVLKENPVVAAYILLTGLYFAAYQQFGYLMPLDMGRVHGEDGALIFGTVNSLNCLVVILFTPVLTQLFRRMTDTRKTLTGILLQGAGFVLFSAMLGRVPMYYLAMLLFTWGEIFATLAQGPYLTSRVPASHRGRINGVMAVTTSAVTSLGQLAVGRIFDTTGSAAAWGFTLGLDGLALALCLAMIIWDRRRYPGLYEKR